MYPASAPGATPSYRDNGVPNHNKKRNRSEFEAGGLYQAELFLNRQTYSYRVPKYRDVNGAYPHTFQTPVSPGYRPPQRSVQGGLLPQQNSNISTNPSPMAYRPPQPFSRAQQNNHDILANQLPFAYETPDQFSRPQQNGNISPHQPPFAYTPPQPLRGIQQNNHNILPGHSPYAYAPSQPLGHSGLLQQHHNGIRGHIPEVQNHQRGLNRPQLNISLNSQVGAIRDRRPYVVDNCPRALDNGDIPNWNILENLEQSPEDQRFIDYINGDHAFQDLEFPYLPDGGVPRQRLWNNDDIPIHHSHFIGLRDINRGLDLNPPHEAGSREAESDDDLSEDDQLDEVLSEDDQSDEDLSEDDQLDEDLSEDDLSQDDLSQDINDNEILEDDELSGNQQQLVPAVMQNLNLKICDEHECGEPTFYLTQRARKCRFHLENPPPQTRWEDLDHAPTADPDACSGCNGLRPRRAPGRTCWECLCKNRRQRYGVCDGCPASWCPNRVVEGA
ncbi:hypothetical protein GE21DRAFT_5020 [Neurospora crassa]|uniref:Uncharacterized protein n=1 Tax=Neurospora crassa (strain ATCC 24698 / 74-OR23-1A / CBS 708.71 / DSM 1257 / FGSC 987) TaxID=367110 RepID=Q7S3K5_NEUCR|nr:hypothetical protein NCU08238 [Neurospora crassa OR74A]EAA30092.1 hypothetical protein NCU08238 [Neurospora crassa OR74A]KHE86494.1 hypothetical protein GE21DRAFT_5020 [Neurospora crassa]|eukprot:XP_959328.1 hypothetical protein NCU08238 [Neurospora crassa OR74A]